MLQILASVQDPSLLNASPPMSHKRDREEDILDTRQGASAETPEEPRVIAGSQRASRAVSHVELIAAAQLLHERSITPKPDIQQHQPSRQPHQPLYDLPLNINHQSPVSLDFLNQWSSSTTFGIAQHDPNVPSHVDSWFPSANTDTSPQTTLFPYHQLELGPLTPDTQTMTYNTPVGMGTSMNGMQVADRSPAAQASTANQAQRWHDSGPASSTTSPIFQFQNWADQPGVANFDYKHPKMSQHQPHPRQVRTGPSAGPPRALPHPPRDRHLHRHHHTQQSQPTMLRRDAPPPPPTFMEPLLNPQQQEPLRPQPPTPHQSAFNHNTLPMWPNTHTASECVSLHSIQLFFFASELTRCYSRRLANWSTY